MRLGTCGDDLIRGVLVRRYKRFLADCILSDGEPVTAHCPNTGSMKTLLAENSPVWLKTHDNPKRKLPYTLTLMGVGEDDWALIDTTIPNHLVREGILQGRTPCLAGYQEIRSEVAYGSRKSRIDLLLSQRSADYEDPRACYVEIKNVTMMSATNPGRADFPDSQTARGKKHLLELADMVEAGNRCVQFYLLGRTDCARVGIADYIDADYAASLRDALAAGVEVICQGVEIVEGEITLGAVCPFEF